MERRSAPIITLSLADSNSIMVTTRRPARAASSAASFTRLARSAPEKPGVPRAMTRASTSGASGTLRIWTLRICSRPRMSGLGTTTWRSKRPGRSSAGSSTSGRLVAAIRMTPSFASKPSISTSSWFRVCSRSSLPPPSPAPRWRPTASISSMKMMQGAFFLPCSNMSRTRLAPTPTNISTKSEPEMVEFLRILEVLDDLLELLLGLVDAGDVVEGDAADLLRQQPGAALAEAHGAAAAALHLAHEEDPDADQQQHREPRDEDTEQRGDVVLEGRRGDADLLVGQAADQVGIVRRIGREGAAVGEVAVDVVSLDGDVGDLAAIDVADEIGEWQTGLRTAGRRSLK